MSSPSGDAEVRRGLVLVVDDDPDALFILPAALEHGGYEVCLAVDGETAIAAVKRERPDVVILDFAMPRLSGPEVLALLKADPATSSIPVIACTAVPVPGDVPLLRLAGYADVLLKPVDPSAMVAAVERVYTQARDRESCSHGAPSASGSN